MTTRRLDIRLLKEYAIDHAAAGLFDLPHAEPAGRQRAVNFFAPLRRTWSFAAESRPAIILGLVCVPIAALMTLAIPVLAGKALDVVIGLADAPDRAAELWWLCAGVLGAGVGEAVLRLTARRALINASRRVEERLKNELMRHLLRLPAAWFDRARTGDLISRFTQDVELLRFVVGPAVLHGGVALVVIPGGIYLMASLSWKVCLATAAAFAMLLASLTVLLPRLHEHSKAVQESIGDISQRASEDFAGIRVLFTFARASDEERAVRRLADGYLEHNVRLARTRAWINLFIHSSRELVIVAILAVGVGEAIDGTLTTGELFQFLMLSSVIVWPLLATSWILAVVHRSFAAAERIEEIFEAEPEEDRGARPELRGGLSVRGLTFSYAEREAPALRDVSFELAAGQKLGIVGPVGSGKTTLLALITRLYEPPRGAIFVDDVDVRDIHPATLRAAFASAPQDPFLFSDTIRGNIAFGTGDAPDHATDEATDPGDLIDPAIHASAVDQDLDAYPEGIESLLGERGMTLSGGQRQRVSLARALASPRPALLLDDTLSAVDHGTEATILARLSEARRDRTTIVASHRLSAVQDADLILVLDGGRVVERGTHAQLLEQNGHYARLHRHQQESTRSTLEDGP